MIKLYKDNGDGSLSYHEAWMDGTTVVEHWGVVGERGETAEHRKRLLQARAPSIEPVLEKARADGYTEIDEDKVAILMIEYTVDGMGDASDLEKRHALESRMNETLGWTALGHCDGGSIGSGTMEVCCVVVDYATAERVVRDDLAASEFADYSRIYDEDA